MTDRFAPYTLSAPTAWPVLMATALLAGCASGPAPESPVGLLPAGPPQAGAAANACAVASGPLTVSVGDTFADGDTVRDFLTGQTATVRHSQITLTPGPNAEGLMLLEAADAQPGQFRWGNATVYFALTDRFANGRTDNDHAYGRMPDEPDNIGTFHGGDFAGLTDKLDYLSRLGVNALWVSPPFEQMHGWVGGGDQGDFRHYGYHGYYALDFTVPDANFGTRAEFRTLVQEAHKRCIRVLMDVVMNHPGYSTLQDMQTFDFGALRPGFEKYLPARWGDWQPESWENLHAYHALIDYDAPAWDRWWGKDWVRAGIADYDTPPSVTLDEKRGSLSFLPDFKTEATQTVTLPTFLANKPDTRATELPNATVRDYLITWLTQWVRDFGVDGFRVDTAKHVELDAWAELKQRAQQALDDYRADHPKAALPGDRFWMVGEVFPHSVTSSAYFDNGFDAVINFDLQEQALDGARCLPAMEPVYEAYAGALRGEQPFNVLSYLSSHDTNLFSRMANGDPVLEKRAAAALMLTPGAVQVFYGDETGRHFGPTGSDPLQGTRSDMNWPDIASGKAQPVLSYWQALGRFRERHPAIGAGQHTLISRSPYVFARTTSRDRALIVFGRQQP
ncbi:alpha-amylase [Marinobacter sp. C2H3]|uniref:alpha-amylase n=1 Tax=Marinobacter sp. C2H3 TaxID=3119003 RepID=UPI00300F3A0D